MRIEKILKILFNSLLDLIHDGFWLINLIFIVLTSYLLVINAKAGYLQKTGVNLDIDSDVSIFLAMATFSICFFLITLFFIILNNYHKYDVR